jgi:hypothetical protein
LKKINILEDLQEIERLRKKKMHDIESQIGDMQEIADLLV